MRHKIQEFEELKILCPLLLMNLFNKALKHKNVKINERRTQYYHIYRVFHGNCQSSMLMKEPINKRHELGVVLSFHGDLQGVEKKIRLFFASRFLLNRTSD